MQKLIFQVYNFLLSIKINYCIHLELVKKINNYRVKEAINFIFNSKYLAFRFSPLGASEGVVASAFPVCRK